MWKIEFPPEAYDVSRANYMHRLATIYLSLIFIFALYLSNSYDVVFLSPQYVPYHVSNGYPPWQTAPAWQLDVTPTQFQVWHHLGPIAVCFMSVSVWNTSQCRLLQAWGVWLYSVHEDMACLKHHG